MTYNLPLILDCVLEVYSCCSQGTQDVGYFHFPGIHGASEGDVSSYLPLTDLIELPGLIDHQRIPWLLPSADHSYGGYLAGPMTVQSLWWPFSDVCFHGEPRTKSICLRVCATAASFWMVNMRLPRRREMGGGGERRGLGIVGSQGWPGRVAKDAARTEERTVTCTTGQGGGQEGIREGPASGLPGEEVR